MGPCGVLSVVREVPAPAARSISEISNSLSEVPLTSPAANEPQAEPPPVPPELIQAPWQWWRAQMPVTQQWAYFDHAAVAPLSQPARVAITALADQAATDGDTQWPQWNNNLQRLRRQFAELLGCAASEICLVPNTTTGLNLIAEGFPFQRGDNIVTAAGEFPSNLFPWLNQQQRGVEVRVVPRRAGGAVDVVDLMEHTDASTRLIAVSWVGYASGYRIDLESLVEQAHQRGVLVCLDAIQGLGMFPLDLAQIPVDFLAADGHKWLLGPEGAGVAMIRQEHQEMIRPSNVGWTSVKQAHQYSDPKFELRNDAARFESGSANMLGAAGLSASVQMFLDVLRAHGRNAIEQRILAQIEVAEQRLRNAGATLQLAAQPQHRSGIINFTLPGADPQHIRSRGLESGVVLSCRGGGVRASLHVYHNEQDLDRLIELLSG